MNWYIAVLKKYAVFQGRAQRMEYWIFVLISMIITIVLSVVDGAVGLFDPATGLGLLSGIYSLAVLIPSTSVAVRRLHDIDKSGWWLLICLVPLLGILILIVLMALDSNHGDNKYGPNPKQT